MLCIYFLIHLKIKDVWFQMKENIGKYCSHSNGTLMEIELESEFQAWFVHISQPLSKQ